MLAGIANHRTAASLIRRLNAQVVRHYYQLARHHGWHGQTLGRRLKIIEAAASYELTAAEQATWYMTSVSSVEISGSCPSSSTSVMSRSGRTRASGPCSFRSRRSRSFPVRGRGPAGELQP